MALNGCPSFIFSWYFCHFWKKKYLCTEKTVDTYDQSFSDWRI